MSLLGVDRVFELAGRLKAACDGARANMEQCRILAHRAHRIASEIRKVDAATATALARRPGLGELGSTLTSGIALCQKYDNKSYLKLIWSHTSDAEKFNEIFKRLDAACQDMQLGLAFDQRALAEAQKADGVALQKLLADLQQGQGGIQQGQQLIIDLLKKQQLGGGGGGGGDAAGNPREQWRLDPKADYTFDKDDDDDKIELGSGSFGTVFRGKFLSSELVAIKSVKFKTDKEMAAFRTEVTLLFRLEHPNVTNLYGASIKGKKGDWKGDMVLEFFPGSLSTVIYGGQQLSQAQMFATAVQMASAMAYLHGASPKVIHRDLKPDNVMITAKGKAKIIDFGLAATKNSSASSATKVGAAGTVQYMAPELLSGDFTGNHLVDSYAYGILVNEMFAGKLPFDDMNSQQMKDAIVKGSRPEVPASMPVHLKEVVVACMAGDPSRRPEFQAIQFRLQHAGEIAAMEQAAGAEQEAKRRQAAAARAPAAPAGSVFLVKNCEVPFWNGYYCTKTTVKATVTKREETHFQLYGKCHMERFDGPVISGLDTGEGVEWSGSDHYIEDERHAVSDLFYNKQNTESPPTSGWFKRSDDSPSAMRIVYM